MGIFSRKKTYSTVPSAGWRILESFPGAWQQNVEYEQETILAFHATFSCITLIASDIAKLRPRIVRQTSDGIWVEIPSKEFGVIEKPNSFQNRIQFFENWLSSKLARGNAYILKQRNASGDVVALYVLNPDLVQVLVSESGEVFYQLGQDNLTDLRQSKIVPASEIIHDRFNCLYHPLVGLSPLTACGMAAYQGVKILENGAIFFQNQSRPCGILSTPGSISDEDAALLKTQWETNYGGENTGKVAVLGNDLKYIPMAISAEQSQLVEQLKMDSDVVCSAFHVPKYKVLSDPPSYNNIGALNQQYYSQCLQIHIEGMELCLDEGLSVPKDSGVEFDLDGLLRMDPAAQVETLVKSIGGGLDTPNEARKKANSPPLPGGDTVYLQQQMFSMEALSKRDQSEDPFGTGKSDTPDEKNTSQEDEKLAILEFQRGFDKCPFVM